VNIGATAPQHVTAGFLNTDWNPRDLPAGASTRNVVLRTDDGAATTGSLYQPGGKRPRTVVCIMHPREFMACHYLIPDIVGAGLAAWSQGARSVGNDLRLEHEIALHDVAAGLAFLRVRDEGDALSVDPELDPLNPDNGYRPGGQARYAPEFVRRYREAQRERVARLDAQARELIARRLTARKSIKGREDATQAERRLAAHTRCSRPRARPKPWSTASTRPSPRPWSNPTYASSSIPSASRLGRRQPRTSPRPCKAIRCVSTQWLSRQPFLSTSPKQEMP